MHVGISVKGGNEHRIIALLPEGHFVPSTALGADIFFDPNVSPL
jgi:hypothetical protein